MNKKLLLSVLFCSFCLSPLVQANDKVEKIYDAQLYQKVCKGKAQGTEVSFAHRGIIWNGTCEPQFFPKQSRDIMGNERELFTTCAGTHTAMSANINGAEVRGKCALGFTPPQPK
ncbi:hypothetical protein [Acinetobacter sp. GSS19]|uniref:hypothetical protein n=1 Tax=Acinetobacter sp. GSS19 TaxID=3020716 RepID=UPI002361D205|nr:hypothetical protein [Acinetobacter sp. GSS19]